MAVEDLRAEERDEERDEPDAVAGDAPLPSVRRALTWNLGNNAVSRVATFATGIVLARLLEPADFGRFTVAAVILAVIANVNDLGLEPTLVRWPGDISRAAPTAMTIMLVSSGVVFVATMFAAPLLADMFGAPGTEGLIRVLAIGVLVNGVCAVASGSLTRDLRQDRRAAADLGGLVVATPVTIGLAATGAGPWSLTWGRLAGNATTSAMHFRLARLRMRPSFDRDVARELVRCGVPFAATSLLGVALMNVDYLVVSRVLGPAALGTYLLAFNLSSWPVSMFSTAVANVAVPAFARLQHDTEALAVEVRRWARYLAAVTIPTCLALAVLADPIVRILYGERWLDAVPVLRALAVVGALRVAIQLGVDLFTALGRGPGILRWQGIWLVALVPALAVGARIGGTTGVAVGHVLVAGLLVAPVMLLSCRRALQPSGLPVTAGTTPSDADVPRPPSPRR